MIRWPAFLLVAVLAACAGPRYRVAPAGVAAGPGTAAGLGPGVEAAAPSGTCRVGADGGIPVADRGIGGTGVRVAGGQDRGIGGTGVYADRGIGGTGVQAGGHTGIVGVITGFASVCLAGQEVQYAPGQSVLVDGHAAGPEALRAGQVAAVEAVGGPRPMAVTLMVRHEVSGRVEAIEPSGALRVAGQVVRPPPVQAVVQAGVPLSGAPVGSWLMVSGFHLQDGSIAATRLDLRGPGETLIRGIMRNERGRLWIGLVEVRPGRLQFREPGVPVLAVGRLNDGVLEADTVEPDGLLLDPGVYFGPRVGVLIVEGYAEGGGFWFGRRRLGAPFGAGRALARLERRGGGFEPAFVRPYGPGGFGRSAPGGFAPGGFAPGGRGFEPAPVPNRGFDRARAPGFQPGRGERFGPRRQERRMQDEPQGGGRGRGPP